LHRIPSAPNRKPINRSTASAASPNILVLFIDDMGFADPSCFGNPLIKTPHIDQLAAEGIKLTNFYVNSPICSASRVAITTGQYQGRWKIHSYLNTRPGHRPWDTRHFCPQISHQRLPTNPQPAIELDQIRFFAKAFPADVFKYRSNSSACSRSLNAR
jgi:hypothetical protein